MRKCATPLAICGQSGWLSSASKLTKSTWRKIGRTRWDVTPWRPIFHRRNSMCLVSIGFWGLWRRGGVRLCHRLGSLGHGKCVWVMFFQSWQQAFCWTYAANLWRVCKYLHVCWYWNLTQRKKHCGALDCKGNLQDHPNLNLVNTHFVNPVNELRPLIPRYCRGWWP